MNLAWDSIIMRYIKFVLEKLSIVSKKFLIICEYSFLYLLRFIGNIPNESTSITLTTKTSHRIVTSTQTHK